MSRGQIASAPGSDHQTLPSMPQSAVEWGRRLLGSRRAAEFGGKAVHLQADFIEKSGHCSALYLG